jgi:glycosyltransferase involved in cell wall biosynthesis
MRNKLTFSNQTSSNPVFILLSTFNGECYLEALLDSLLIQKYSDFRIVIRDDGSSDATLAIIDSYCREYPDKVIRSQLIEGNIGVTKSFLSLLEHVEEGAYVMFCDQDDVWFENKINKFMVRMQETERESEEPVLVFGDMVVTDYDLNVVSRSFWSYQRLDPRVAKDWRRLMVGNVVTGCSLMFNSAARSQLLTAPSLPILHDHLLAIVVARCGVVAKLSQPTMFYRQHSKNVEGARAFGVSYLFSRCFYFLKVISPRYLLMCKTFDVPFTLAVYLKIESVFCRLLRLNK